MDEVVLDPPTKVLDNAVETNVVYVVIRALGVTTADVMDVVGSDDGVIGATELADVDAVVDMAAVDSFAVVELKLVVVGVSDAVVGVSDAVVKMELVEARVVGVMEVEEGVEKEVFRTAVEAVVEVDKVVAEGREVVVDETK